MTILAEYFGPNNWIMTDGDDLAIIKLNQHAAERGDILFANYTNMAELGFWMANLLPGKDFDIQDREKLIAVLYQKDGKQTASIYKLTSAKQITLGDRRLAVFETATILPPVKEKEFAKIYANKLILKLAQSYQNLQGIFIDTRYEELLGRLAEMLKDQARREAFRIYLTESPAGHHPNNGTLHIDNSQSPQLVN